VATAAQLKSLLRSYSEADGERFLAVATQIAAHAARSGKTKLAAELKELLEEIKQKQQTAHIGGAVPIARPRGELLSVLSVSYPKTRLSEMVLGDIQRELLDRVLHEYRQQAKLREHGLTARRKLLLAGPPGCGKTMTSKALAGELKMPHFAVQLHALITKFMGETAAKLHAVFEAMKETRGVYLFDEFDAIGGERASKNDVGEIRRVLNSFLQFLEQDDSDSLIVSATNNVQILDDALFRRFDDVIVYERPDPTAIRQLVSNRLALFTVPKFNWREIESYAEGLSHAEICQACDDAAKDAVLADRRCIDEQVLYRALQGKQQRRFNR
jgi:SpoVK/Ycf46/Vps4 family AAA+-type ATPase